MKIAILGAGALGCYYGARLQESGQDVSFIVRSEYGYLKEHGLQVKSLHGNISLPRINVYRDTEEVGPVDLVVVAWKSTANAGFSRALPTLMGPDTTVVTLQNGMGNAEEIARIIPADRIYVGLCFICAMREKPGHVNHLEGGNIQFAPFIPTPEGTEKARELSELFANAGIKTRAFDAAEQIQWYKLVWNIPFNGLCLALGGISIAELYQNPETSCGRAASWRKWCRQPKPAAMPCRKIWLNSTFPVRKPWELSFRPAPWTTTKAVPSNTRLSGETLSPRPGKPEPPCRNGNFWTRPSASA